MRYRRMQARQDMRAILPVWLLANAHKDPEVRREPFEIDEILSWLDYQREPRRPAPPVVEPEPMTPDELAEHTALLARLYYGSGTEG